MGKKRDYTKYSKENEKPVEQVSETAFETITVHVPRPVVEEKQDEPVVGIVTDCVKLNVRENPSSTALVVAVIDASTELVIIEEESTKDFFKVCTASGIEGYCMKKFITIMP